MINPLANIECKLVEIIKLKDGDKLLVYTLPEDALVDCSAESCDDLAVFAEVLIEASRTNPHVCFNCQDCLERLKSFQDTPTRVTPINGKDGVN